MLVIGIEAADPRLVRELLGRGELPALGRLLEEGAWTHVESPANITSGAVWPTFFTGRDPTEHEVTGAWCWQPDRMGCTAPDYGSRTTPFWKALHDNGMTVGVLDVPFSPFLGLSRGFEVLEWGAHDPPEVSMRVSPRMLRKVVSQTVHPFSVRRRRPGAPEDLEELTRLGSECAAGARVRGEFAARLISDTRPDLAIVVFTEVHHVSHPLWHTVVPHHSLYAGESFPGDGSLPVGVAEVYREVDRQIGRLVKAARRNSDVIALSLHGIKPARGIVTVLDPLLCGLGFAHRPDWSTRSWSGQVRASLAQIKRHIPSAVKRSYHSTLPPALRRRLARTTILPVYDWSRTRAFSLPTDQHGLVRLNVVGREASGIVPPEQYQEMCELVAESLLGVTRDDGQPVVRDVIRLSEAGEPPPHRLPDLVVHWHDAAFARPLRTASPRVEAHPVRLDRTGEHAPDGFSIMRGDFGGERIGESTLARDLHRYALAGLGVG